MRSEHGAPGTAIVLLAAATGARSMTGLAAVARETAGTPPLLASVVATCAAMEMVGDKLPFIPDRTDPLPLLGRMAAGAIVGAAVSAAASEDRMRGAAVGAAVAFVAAHASYRLRAAIGRSLPPVAAGLLEDAIVLSVAAAGVRALRSGGLPAKLGRGPNT